MEKENFQAEIQEQIRGILPTVREVIVNPGGFYATMPRSGGFLQPLVFMIVLGVVSGLILSVLSLIGLAPGGGLITGLAALIIVPILIGIFGFIVAAVLFVIWKIMGSQESYETAYRCMAYTAAIMPITTVLNLIPYLGVVIGLVWVTYLLVTASVKVHGIQTQKAWIGFGVICAVFVFASVSAEMAAKKLSSEMQAWETEMLERTGSLERIEEMTPEQAGQALGEFFRGMQESMEDRQ